MTLYDFLYSKKPLYTVLKIAAIVGGSYWVGRKLFRAPDKPALPKSELPTGGSGIPVVRTGPTGKPVVWSPSPLASELYEAMDGFDWTEVKEKAWRKMLELPTDDMFTATYNYFNIMPQVVKADAGTLTQWVRDEGGAWGSGSAKPGLIRRLNALQLA